MNSSTTQPVLYPIIASSFQSVNSVLSTDKKQMVFPSLPGVATCTFVFTWIATVTLLYVVCMYACIKLYISM